MILDVLSDQTCDKYYESVVVIDVVMFPITYNSYCFKHASWNYIKGNGLLKHSSQFVTSLLVTSGTFIESRMRKM